MTPERNRNGAGLFPVVLACLLLALPLAAQDISGGGGGGSSSTASDITTDLVHQWEMEPGSCSGNASTVTDAGSAEEDLTCTNTPQWSSTTCAVGSCCIDFTSASSEHCETTTSPTIPTGDFTWAFWARIDAADSAVYSVMNGSGGNEMGFVFVVTTPTMQPAFKTTVYNLSDEGVITVDDWIHVAVIRENGTMWVYANGRLAATRLVSDAAATFSTCQIQIGVDADATCNTSLGNYFDGQLDDFRIYSRALKAADVEALYALGN